MATAVGRRHDLTMPAEARTRLAALPDSAWRSALGPKDAAHRKGWQILDGVQ
ncbi:hypothetical protein [Streptomyces achromogenes]|uniref:hypothetical protein n=1 Tax=Streptomyces achromogenes TaxID=67255 RepID=UPI003A802682